MARRPRSRLETPAGRLRLKPRRKPYFDVAVASGVTLGLRRNSKGSNVWVARAADGRGGNWIKNIKPSADYEDADGVNILDCWQAIDAARKLTRGTDDE